MKLQPAIKDTNSSKYLSESLSKVEKFQNGHVTAGIQEKVVQFTLDKKGYDSLMKSSVNQVNSKGVNAVKYNFEGLKGTDYRNIGVPATKLEEFNSIIINIKYLD